eukprot:1216093-Alexandrium_andersonii.AAC.1
MDATGVAGRDVLSIKNVLVHERGVAVLLARYARAQRCTDAVALFTATRAMQPPRRLHRRR